MRVAAIAVTFNTFTSPTKHSLTQIPLRLTNHGQQELSWSHLNHSNSDKLAKSWMEYQGINNWKGLLDPLDDVLRSEILRYGQFVEAAYRAFDFDDTSPTFGSCKFSKNSLLTRACVRETGYKPTKNLRATCGIQLPDWIDRGPSWVSTRSTWIGYVSVCQDKSEIARLGRRDVVIAFRGTATFLEWVENLRATLTDVGGRDGACGAMVVTGFWSLYTSGNTTCPSLQQMVREEIGRVVETYDDEPLSLTVTGHSLGAALAILAAHDINSNFNNAPSITVISFGGPRVGNQSFRCQLEKSGTKILRIVNSDDLITKVPGFVVDNNDIKINSAVFPSWAQRHVEDAQLVYADVGQELRLSSRVCPHLSKGGVATSHELGTYMELVNGFVSSNCPFRGTTSRGFFY